jgi:hypothetical protein
MFRKEHAELAQRLNEHLRAMKDEGLVEAIAARYR